MSVVVDKNSVSIDTTVGASTGVETSNDYSSASINVSVKAGTSASAEAGLEGNNVSASVSYSDTVEAHVTTNTEINKEGCGVAVETDTYIKSGNEANASITAGSSGLAVDGNVSIGSSVGFDATQTINMREGSITGGAGVSIGEHFEAGGGGEATFKDGKATIGVSGDLAAVVGVEVDVSVTVDTKQIEKDSKVVVNETVKDANIVANETTKVANTISHEADKVINKAGSDLNKAGNDLKKTGNSISRGFKKIFRL